MNCKFGTQALLHHTISNQNVLEIQQILNNDEDIREKLNIMDDHYISTNDITMSIASGALRGVLLKSSDEDERESVNNSIFKTLMVVAKPFEMEQASEIQNSWIVASVPYLANIEDHIQRCIQTANKLKPIKQLWHLWTNFFVLANLGNLWIDAIKCVSYRLSCTHTCHYSMLNFTAYKENDTFIFGTDIMVNDIGVFVGDMVKTHVVEIFKFGNKMSLNMTVGQKGQESARKWFEEFEQVSYELLHNLKEMQLNVG